jgi:cytochrome c oxidase assembly protein subunit 15
VGVLVVALTRWLGGRESRRWLIGIGLAEIVGGVALIALGPTWKGTGHFLSGIGGVVLLAGIVWVRNIRLPAPLPQLGWAAFVLVQVQGLLGGLRVVLDAHILADVRLGTAFGILHGCLGQLFLVLLAVIALFTTRWWGSVLTSARQAFARNPSMNAARSWVHVATAMIFLQLVFGAAMRHQHAGLAVPDFPLAHGRIYPSTDAASVQRYNAGRSDHREFNRITAFQIHLHMLHRLTGIVLAVLVPVAAWKFRRAARGANAAGARLAGFWAALIVLQAALGIGTVLLNKPADVATAHVMIGALCLVVGSVLLLVTREFSIATAKPVMQSRARSLAQPTPQIQT